MGWVADLLKEIPSAARYKAELEAMEKENITLKAEITVLKSENVNLRQEIQRRDDIVKEQESSIHNKNLEEVKEKILVLLSKHSDLTEEQISGPLNIGIQLAKFHLEELKKESMVSDFYAMDSPVYWSIDQGGRSYLFAHSLLV